MNKRQREQLNKLADFIEKNPTEFDQWAPKNCIIGLGNRLVRGKLKPYELGGNIPRFFKKYGVSYETAVKLYVGAFNSINKQQKNMDISSSKPKSAVTVLRYLTKQ